MSAWRAAARWPFGPLPPMRIGIALGRGPTGCWGRSRAACQVPSKSAWPPRRSGMMIWSASSKRPKMWSSGSPKARAWPGHSWPAPRPKTKRPPLISSSVSAVLAMIPALRWRADRTHVPTFVREVTAATAPAIETPSQTPCGAASFGSPQELVGRPDRVEADLFGPQRHLPGCRPSGRSAGPGRTGMRGRTIPISNEPIRPSAASVPLMPAAAGRAPGEATARRRWHRGPARPTRPRT